MDKDHDDGNGHGDQVLGLRKEEREKQKAHFVLVIETLIECDHIYDR